MPSKSTCTERMKLNWPTLAPTQDRAAYQNFVPTQAPPYWTRVFIKQEE